MRARLPLTAGALVCALTLLTTGATGAPGTSTPSISASPSAATSKTGTSGGTPSRRPDLRAERGPQHTSDGQPGWRAPVVPRLLAGLPPSRTDPTRSVVAPGVTLTRWDEADARGPQRFSLLTVDPSVPGVSLDYAGARRVSGTATLPTLLSAAYSGPGTVAGVNGDFFDIGDTGAPLGTGRDVERGVLHGRASGWTSSFSIDKQGRPDIGEVPLRASVKQRPGMRITNLNSPFVEPGGIGIYTAAWGTTSGYRVTSGQRKQVRMVLVRGGKVVRTRARLTSGTKINGVLLVGRGPGAKALAQLRKGARLDVKWWLQGGPRMAISGNKVLVRDGVVEVVDDRVMHPRTAIGVDRDTGEVLVLVVDGRKTWSRGATMVELAATMIDLGADEALNLDGGGSTTMLTRGGDGRLGVVNTPSDGHLRQVANGIQVRYRP
ncbi:phosphodiester glycosidase family protein [Nocardioides abyssi]|uniref:Phosphodiester glycosidase family protein n=1 Tax=Nocardioides abyssi TaxID=3058370 RepID=A0ABT8EPH0_9ACTN|nr:phosphodiester glycosidase family protein [Nocardioides abyssi]MDN4160030.1 phosphodiester glycosidase family protein [Nocardioides abyssi]